MAADLWRLFVAQLSETIANGLDEEGIPREDVLDRVLVRLEQGATMLGKPPSWTVRFYRRFSAVLIRRAGG